MLVGGRHNLVVVEGAVRRIYPADEAVKGRAPRQQEGGGVEGPTRKASVPPRTAVKLQFTRNPAIDVAADCLAAPRRNFQADSAAHWQRAPPLDHVQDAAVRAAWHES